MHPLIPAVNYLIQITIYGLLASFVSMAFVHGLIGVLFNVEDDT